MEKKRLVYFGQAFQNGAVSSEHFALLNESPDDVDAHRDGLRAVEDIGGHDRAMFGEGVREILLVLAFL